MVLVKQEKNEQIKIKALLRYENPNIWRPDVSSDSTR